MAAPATAGRVHVVWIIITFSKKVIMTLTQKS